MYILLTFIIAAIVMVVLILIFAIGTFFIDATIGKYDTIITATKEREEAED